MRRGHRKRLSVPKPGAVATRGRAVSARSVNPTRRGRTDSSKRRVFRERGSEKSLQHTGGTQQCSLWRALQHDIRAAVTEFNEGTLCRRGDLDVEHDIFQASRQMDVEDCCMLVDQDCFRDAMFAADFVRGTAIEPLAMMNYCRAGVVSLLEDSSRTSLLQQCAQFWALRWQVALTLANVVAHEYARRIIAAAPAAPPASIDDLAALQEKFLHQHGHKILSSLSMALKPPITMRPAPLARSVPDAFIKAAHSSWDKVRPTLHGTDAANHESIFAHGLLIPGAANRLKVRHGAAHGAGVYTSTLENAWLSKGFCTEPRLLVCGVVDDAKPLAQPQLIGRLMMTSESSTVRHVGGAIVVLDESRVLPLFEASALGFASGAQPFVGAQAPAAPARSTSYHIPSHHSWLRPFPQPQPWGARAVSRGIRAAMSLIKKTPGLPRGGLRRAAQKRML